MDIVCEVNGEFVILIEDKTHTKNRTEQLESYLNVLSGEYEREKIFPVYLKTGDQGEYNAVRAAGYKPFLRQDFLRVLQFGIGNGVANSIFTDFYKYLVKRENLFKASIPCPLLNGIGIAGRDFTASSQDS